MGIANGYKVDFGRAKTLSVQLEQALNGLDAEIKKLEQIEGTMLDDSNWKRPNKNQFKSEFDEYEAAIVALSKNGWEHYNALQKVLQTYANAER